MCIGRYIHRLITPASRGFASLRQPSKCGIMIHYLGRDVNAVTHRIAQPTMGERYTVRT
jgi:hypothetical protein